MGHAKTGLTKNAKYNERRIGQNGGRYFDLYAQQQTTTSGEVEKRYSKGIEMDFLAQIFVICKLKSKKHARDLIKIIKKNWICNKT